MRRRFIFPPFVALLAAALATSGSARADDRAIAQQAFQEGRALLAQGKIAEACPKFAAAAELSQTAGVRLNLADCYARLGKTASAWAKANDALALAERAGDAAAVALAREQMAALQPKLAYLTIAVVRDGAPVGLEVTLDGEPVPAAVWGTPLPVDPGDHRVEAKAPGRKSVALAASVAALARASLTVPALAPVEGIAPAPQPPAPAALVPSGSDEAVRSGSPLRTVGIVTGAVGVAGLGVGTGFGIVAASKKSDYQSHQVGGRCVDQACVSLSKDAVSAATASTVGFVAGAALVALGVVLWIAAPSSHGETGAIAFVPSIGPGGFGAGLTGSFR